MTTYTVTIKNITANVANMLVQKGETKTIEIRTSNEETVVTKAVKQLFDGCAFLGEDIQNTGGQYGQISAPGKGTTNLYGRIYVTVEAA